MKTAFRHLPAALLDIFVPPMCIVCRKGTANAQKICAQCWGQMAFIAPPICDVLGIPSEIEIARGGEAYVSMRAQTYPPEWRKARAAAVYTASARQIVHKFKYGDGLPLGPFMAQAMARAGQDILQDADVLIPIPLHWSRLMKRQYNQAGILARLIGESSEVPVMIQALKRKHRTKSQVGLTRAQRIHNVHKAFRIVSKMAAQLQGKRVVLVDDVLTTGATLNEAARILEKMGVKSVDVLVFAMVVPNMEEYSDNAIFE